MWLDSQDGSKAVGADTPSLGACQGTYVRTSAQQQQQQQGGPPATLCPRLLGFLFHPGATISALTAPQVGSLGCPEGPYGETVMREISQLAQRGSPTLLLLVLVIV